MWKHDTIPPKVEKMNEHKEKIIVIVGPTASGKTALSLRIAQEIGGEIISADSRQIYRGLDLGTGKVTKAEMDDIPHHLLDIKSPEETYSAADFTKDADRTIEGIISRGKVPVVAGGTFFYIEALLRSMSLPAVPPNPELRDTLEGMDTDAVFSLLKEKDPIRALSIDPKNKRRVIRAIEIADALGSVPPLTTEECPYEAYIIGIDMPKEILHERIKVRLMDRIEGGMIDEAKELQQHGLSFERMDELGLEYRYMAKYLKGECTEEEMKEKLESEIRHFARRQMSWLKRMEGINWYTSSEIETAIKDAVDFLKK